MLSLGRVHKTRAVLGGVVLVAFVVLVHQSFFKSGSDGFGKIRMKMMGGGIAMGKSEFNAEMSLVEKCPVCLGKEMCSDLARKDLEISRTPYAGSAGRLRAAVHQVYHVNNLKYIVRPMTSWPLLGHAMDAFEDYICKNSSFPLGKYCRESCTVK
jgi:hypothetical protein